jgi:hypothetical protein
VEWCFCLTVVCLLQSVVVSLLQSVSVVSLLQIQYMRTPAVSDWFRSVPVMFIVRTVLYCKEHFRSYSARIGFDIRLTDVR